MQWWLQGETWLHAAARPEDIIEFLAYKDVSGVGRTVVHDINCTMIGESSTSVQCDPMKCMMVIAMESISF